MATVIVHHTPCGGPVDPNSLVDGPTYDADPHIVMGLENVDNTSDANKPVSTAQSTADALVASNAATALAAEAVLARNASNLSGGTVPASRLPVPSASTLGGIESLAAVTSRWINTISTSGVPSATQPAFSDISGSVAAAQMPAGTTTNDSAAAGYVGEFQASGLLTGVPDAAPSTGAPNVTVTMTIASPAVVTWTAHGLSGITPIVFTTTGALPTGITASTTYWTIPGSITTNTFQLATSIANAIAGTAINTTGSQSGVHTGANFIALTTNVPINIAAISLTAGDWDLNGAINIMGSVATTVSYFTGSPGLTTATLNQTPSASFAQTYGGGTPFATLTWVTNVLPVTRFSLSATTTIFLVVQAGFGVSTMTSNGIIRARRVR